MSAESVSVRAVTSKVLLRLAVLPATEELVRLRQEVQAAGAAMSEFIAAVKAEREARAVGGMGGPRSRRVDAELRVTRALTKVQP